MNSRILPDDELGAFCKDNNVAIKHTGAGVLDGLTFAVKDVFHIAGYRTGFGNPDWLRTHKEEIAKRNAIIEEYTKIIEAIEKEYDLEKKALETKKKKEVKK